MRHIKAVLAGVLLTLSFSVAAQTAQPDPPGLLVNQSAIWPTDSTSPTTTAAPARFGSKTMQAQTMAPLAPITVPDQTVVSLAGELPAHDATVGSVAGNAGVRGGAASYEIPIALPPGRNGMQPNVSLSYSSRAGNGIAGMGWSISVLSSVHRCPQTVEQDGQTIAVNFTNSDRLCLDGERLVATSGTYGAINTTYATEIDSFARITQLGGDLANGSTYFKVELKSGETVYYGGNSTSANNARVIPGGLAVPESWLIERRLDRVNNNVIYTYQNFGNAEVLPLAIYYTGFNAAQGDRSVQFAYETRPTTGGANDQSSSYLAGGLTRQSQRLTTITTYAGAETVRQYRLVYGISAATGRSLLQSAQDCGYNGATATCHRPTTFNWQSAAETFNLHVESVLDTLGSNPAYDFDPNSPFLQVYPTGDFNGDGMRELYLQAPSKSDPNVMVYWLLSVRSDRTVAWGMKLPGPQGIGTKPVDFDLDGRADLFGSDSSGNMQIKFWHGPADATDYATAFNASYSPGLPGISSNLADMDGDGRTDLVTMSLNTATCQETLTVYSNRPGTGSNMPVSFVSIATQTLNTQSIGGACYFETLQKLSDVNGDGLPDIWLNPTQLQTITGRVLMASKPNATTYSLTSVAYSSLFSGGQTTEEASLNLTSMWMDINGDGLDDFVYAHWQNNQFYWALRLNTGGVLGPLTITSYRNGLELMDCSQTQPCVPRFGSSIADTDADGRQEILIPRHAAARICYYVQEQGSQGHDPPNPYYVCGHDPDPNNTSDAVLIPGGGNVSPPTEQIVWARDDDDDGSIMSASNPSLPEHLTSGALQMHWGQSGANLMNSLHWVETGPGQFSLTETATSLIGGSSGDVYGDGLEDALVRLRCDRTQYAMLSCVSPWSVNGVELPQSAAPRTLQNGLPIMSKKTLISENKGPATNPDGKTPETPDLMSSVTDGLGKQTIWTYYPLSSTAGRAPTDLPLYAVPTDPTLRYIDNRHFYFTSSMQVVSDMIQSDGNGDYRSWRYGYSEAIYNAQGRGMQGFRKIIVEDEANKIRTITIFNQKYPLTGQIDQVIVNSTNRPYTSVPYTVADYAPISSETYTWRCNRADRNDTAACNVTPGSNPVRFPYLDTKITRNYDVATAEAVTGTPKQISEQWQVNADGTPCAGGFTNTSSFDAYGNLAAQATLTYDSGDGTPGYKPYFAIHCAVTRSTFAAADTTNWWLGKLTSRSVIAWASYNATYHPLPSGTSNPVQTVTTNYTWNTDRTPASETVQNGIANQQRVTTYAYPTSNNFGLPSSITVNASGDQNLGGRVVSTTYSADGYFPYVVTDALGHTVGTIIRARDGQPSLSVDVNGQRTTVQYDPFGLVVKVMFRGQTDTVYRAPDKNVALTWCNATCDPGIDAIYLTTEEQDGAPTKIVSYDMLGRPRVSAQRLMDGTWTHSQTQYNARGLTAQQSEPYTTGTPVWTQFTSYDGAGRLTRKVVPEQLNDGRGDMVTTYTYVGRTTNILVCGSNDVGTTPCLSLSRSVDSLGRYEETSDALGGITQFWYDGAGNALALQDAKNTVTKASYNELDQRTQVVDPNQGTSNFTYNALGEVLTQTDARNIVNAFTYDKGGRKIKHTASIDVTGDAVADAIVDTWTFDPLNGVGALAQSKRTVNGVLEKQVDTSYDTLARPIQTDTQQYAGPSDIRTYTTTVQYDTNYGRVKGQTYPTGDTEQIEYSNYGDAIRSRDAATGAIYRQLNTVNARNQPLTDDVGPLSHSYTYAANTGQATQIYLSRSGTGLRQLLYQYDVFGNLSKQLLNNPQAVETFTYDKLQRLTQSTRTGSSTATVTYVYDAVGNITSKSDFSTTAANAYGYIGGSCGGGANAVKSVITSTGTRTYCYDASGNLTADSAGLSVKYDETNHPWLTTRSLSSDTIVYGPNGERVRQSGSDGNRLIVDNLEVDLSNGQTKLYLGTDVEIVTLNGTRTVNYLLKDRLGSVDAVANSVGTIVETRGYDAFGTPRIGDWSDASPPRLQNVANTRKGFTEHEHLNTVELIHMNGRVYDYRLGRFLSVDPLIQAPLNSQSLNPYSYIMNNPLSGTDPTGYARTCDVNGDTKQCTVDMKANDKRDVTREVTGSHLKEKIGTVTQNANGTSTFTDTAGHSATRLIVGASGQGATDPQVVRTATNVQTASSRQPVTSTNASPETAYFAMDGAGGAGSGDNITFNQLAADIGAQRFDSGPTDSQVDEATLAVANYIGKNPTGKVVLMGYSAGGYFVTQVAANLKDANIKVALLLTFDPVDSRSLNAFVGWGSIPITSNVERAVNIFQRQPIVMYENSFNGMELSGNNVMNILEENSRGHNKIVDESKDLARFLLEQVRQNDAGGQKR
jgi:RHS repeat-associated protein